MGRVFVLADSLVVDSVGIFGEERLVSVGVMFAGLELLSEMRAHGIELVEIVGPVSEEISDLSVP